MTDNPKTASLRTASIQARVQPVRLVVLEGPDHGAQAAVEQGTGIIGSHAACELRLTDPTVSRRHASVELLGHRVRVTDLQSKNGTKYLGARITSMEVPLGSVVRVGETQVALLPERLAPGALSERTEMAGLIGRSVRMRRLFAEIEQAARSDAPVLIRGETGSGKEGVARALHASSLRAQGPLRVFDCGAVQPELIASALFGHIKGAFTGAVRDVPGALEEADGGTLFLDEVAELPLELQPTLLRALETHAFVRVGEGRVRNADFRVVAATHQDLAALVDAGKFRRDLYFRLAAIALEVPPLRERIDDVALLAGHFAQQAGARDFKLPASTLAAFTAYRWPGNVRELRNLVERAVTLGPETLDLGGAAAAGAAPEDFHKAREQAIAAFEKSYLEHLLDEHGGSVSSAARAANMARSYLYRLLEQHGIRPRPKR